MLQQVNSNFAVIEQQQQFMITQLTVIITVLSAILDSIKDLEIGPVWIRIQNVYVNTHSHTYYFSFVFIYTIFC
jgi:hypothetical protein